MMSWTVAGRFSVLNFSSNSTKLVTSSFLKKSSTESRYCCCFFSFRWKAVGGTFLIKGAGAERYLGQPGKTEGTAFGFSLHRMSSLEALFFLLSWSSSSLSLMKSHSWKCNWQIPCRIHTWGLVWSWDFPNPLLPQWGIIRKLENWKGLLSSFFLHRSFKPWVGL